MSSNAAFKESSKVQLLQQCILEAGWHFRLEKPILEDFLKHIDHPYKGNLTKPVNPNFQSTGMLTLGCRCKRGNGANIRKSL
jgi:hypothetical protein